MRTLKSKCFTTDRDWCIFKQQFKSDSLSLCFGAGLSSWEEGRETGWCFVWMEEEVCVRCVMFSFSTGCWESGVRPVLRPPCARLTARAADRSLFLRTFRHPWPHLSFRVNVKFSVGLSLCDKKVLRRERARSLHTWLHSLPMWRVYLSPRDRICFVVLY